MTFPDISAKIAKFGWAYKKERFPKLKDDGHAKASMKDTSVRLLFFFFFSYVQNVELRIHPGAALIRSQIAVALTIGGESLQNATVRVTECNVTIGKLDIKTGGTMAR